MRLEGKVALVTGAAAGIGRATSLLFAGEGAQVVAADRDPDGLASVAREATDAGGAVTTVVADVTRPDDVAAMLRAVEERHGSLHALLNIAGIVPVGSIEGTTPEEWDRAMDVNLRSLYLCCREAAPLLKRTPGSCVVNMASVAGQVGLKDRAAYSASKAGVIGLTRALAADWVGDRVRVNCICPGTVDTPSLRARIAAEPDPEAARARYVARQPLGRLGTPEEVAATALYLASDDAAFITGIALVIDGGLSL